jgi:hypothetical protein
MVMTTSEALTASLVRILGCSAAMSMPTSAIAATAAGLTRSAGSEPAERTSTAPCARWVKKAAARFAGAIADPHPAPSSAWRFSSWARRLRSRPITCQRRPGRLDSASRKGDLQP